MRREIHYECQRCTACCRWPGFVVVTEREIAAIATFLGVDEDRFIQEQTRLRPNRDGLALLDKPNGECAFLEGRDCAIQPVKPAQCRAFPNQWNFPGGARCARRCRGFRPSDQKPEDRSQRRRCSDLLASER